jgi:N-acyl homoserine lactone hydrolase
MKPRFLAAMGAASLGVLGIGLAVNSFLPQRFDIPMGHDKTMILPTISSLPAVDVTFLRCGYAVWPECIMVRGAPSFAPRRISYSAILVRHPRATFLYDTGLCHDISLVLMDQSLFFRQTLARFKFERSISSHLQFLGLKPRDLSFALISHLHWDHVGGALDLPGLPLRVNRVEFEAAREKLFSQHQELVPRLIHNNPIELFAMQGPPYAGFCSSLDLFGDGSIMLLPLPGHTAGNTGMLIRRSNGQHLFVVGDAAHLIENYQRPATPHPLFYSRVTSNDALARQTLVDLHRFSRLHPEIPLVPMHDARMQEAFMIVEQARARAV